MDAANIEIVNNSDFLLFVVVDRLTQDLLFGAPSHRYGFYFFLVTPMVLEPATCGAGARRADGDRSRGSHRCGDSDSASQCRCHNFFSFLFEHFLRRREQQPMPAGEMQ
jgi:hypothetical protein